MQTIEHWKLAIAGTIGAVGLLLFGQSTALADDFRCTENLGAITVDNLRVPDRATCTLDGTKVEGSIYVEDNATLIARSVQVDGNVQAENSARVDVLSGSVIGGNIQVVQSGSATIDSITIDADLYFDENSGKLIANQNTIGGNLQAFQNTAGIAITGNTIDGNLQCKENTPRPTGGNNIVHGNKEDQCANLLSGGDDQHQMQSRIGRIDAMPVQGFVGEWVVGGTTYTVTPATSFDNTNGGLTLGGIARVNSYTDAGGKRIATLIRGVTLDNLVYLAVFRR